MKYVSGNPQGCLIKECANGNNDAYLCASALYVYIDWLDNVIDKDIEVPYEVSAKTSMNLFVMLCYNKFWQENKSHLGPILITAYNAWIDSEKIKTNSDYRVRISADVLKGYFLEVFYQIGFITGGYDLMRALSEKWRGFDFDSTEEIKTPCEVKTWLAVTGPREWLFPNDHGTHPEYALEWWYFSGILNSGEEELGYHFCEFRIKDQYIQHFSLTNIGTGQFQFTETASNKPALQVQAGNRFSFNGLELKQSADVLLQGCDGFSVKSCIPGHASHYYSIPKLRTSGTVGGMEVSGESWFDHEFFSFIPPKEIGWAFFWARFGNGDAINGTIMINDGVVDLTHSRLTLLKDNGLRVPIHISDVSRVPTPETPLFIINAVDYTIEISEASTKMCKSSIGEYLEVPCEITVTCSEWSGVGQGYLEITS